MSKGSGQPAWLGHLGSVLFVVLLVLLAWQASTRSVDFPVYHRTAQQLLAGDYELYPPQVYTSEPIPPHGFRYLPIVAWLFVPFGLLPLPVAAFVFYLLKLMALAWTARALVLAPAIASPLGLLPTGGPGADDAAARRVAIIALLVVAGYAAEELRYGNAHLLVVALMVFAWTRTSRGETWLPGAALGLAIAAKITPLALLGYFALRRKFAACAATLIALALLLAAPMVIVGGQTNAHLLKGFVRYALEKTEESDNYSLRGALHRLLAPASEVAAGSATLPTTVRLDQGEQSMAITLTADRESVAWMLLAGLIGIVSLAVLWRASADPIVYLLEFSIVLVLMLIVSPHTQRRYFMQLYVPVLVLLAVMQGGDARERAWARAGIVATAAAGTVLPLVFGGRTLSHAYESAAPYLWAAVVLLAVLLEITWRKKRSEIRDSK